VGSRGPWAHLILFIKPPEDPGKGAHVDKPRLNTPKILFKDNNNLMNNNRIRQNY
jgi:hypothetical protein